MMRYLSSHLSLKLDAERCIGCGLCAAVCPRGVFQIEGKRARLADREACIECGACARNCPVEAATVASGVGCAEAVINGLLTGKETCCGEGECCCSGGQTDDAGSGKEMTVTDDQEKKTPAMKNGTDAAESPETLACGPDCGCHAAGPARRTQKAERVIRCAAGAVLVGAGFYLLAT